MMRKKWIQKRKNVVEEGVFKYKTVEEMVEKSKGLYPGTNYPREGIVYRLKENWNKDKIC